MLLGLLATTASNLSCLDTKDLYSHCPINHLSWQDHLLHQTLCSGTRKAQTKLWVSVWLLTSFVNGIPVFHRPWLPAMFLTLPKRKPILWFERKIAVLISWAALCLILRLLRKYSLIIMPQSYSWTGTDPPNKPEYLQHPVCISSTSSLLWWSSWDISGHLPHQWNSISTPLPTAVLHSRHIQCLEHWWRLKSQYVVIGDFAPFPEQLSCLTSFTQSDTN